MGPGFIGDTMMPIGTHRERRRVVQGSGTIPRFIRGGIGRITDSAASRMRRLGERRPVHAS